ncbi:MAG TPA: hypothetical protein VFW62_09225 [bacterium]|nr:hypothetical protein [bacterium]
MSQTAYPLNMPIGIEGQLSDSGPHDVLTYNNPSQAIPAGRALEKISGDANGVQLPDDGSANIVGLSLRDRAQESAASPVQSAIPVLRKGRILVAVEENVTPESTPHYRYGTKQQQTLIDFSANFVTGNSISLKIRRSILGQFVQEHTVGPVAFSVDHATTAAALDAAIEAVTGASSVATAGNDFTVTAATDVELEIFDVLVTGGASQATATVTETVVARLSTDRGSIRASVDSSTAAPLTGAKFLTAANAGGLAVLDVNLP